MEQYTKSGRELMMNLKDTTARELPVFNRKALLIIISQMKMLYEQNSKDTSTTNAQGTRSLVPAIQLRHAILERNIRIALAYLYVRMAKLRRARWHYGSTLPDFINNNATEQEVQYFHNYSRLLSNYMRSVGLDLTMDWKPQKAYMIQVHVIKDWEMTLDNGEFVKMIAGSIHIMPRQYYENLYKLGVVKIHKPNIPINCTKY